MTDLSLLFPRRAYVIITRGVRLLGHDLRVTVQTLGNAISQLLVHLSWSDSGRIVFQCGLSYGNWWLRWLGVCIREQA